MAYGTCLHRIGINPAYSDAKPSVDAILVKPATKPFAYWFVSL